MKLVVYEWTAFTYNDLYEALSQEGISFKIARIPHSPRKQSEKMDFITKFEEFLKANPCDAVFSINYFDCIAEVCHKNDTMYITWTYDSPSMGGSVQSHYLPTNRIFLFDSAELEKHKKLGKPNLYHLNLAVDTKKYNRIKATPMEQVKYMSQISFVGQLYETQMQEIMATLEPYSAAYLNALADIQMRNYNMNLMEPLITDGLVEFIKTPEFVEKMKPLSENIGLPNRVGKESVRHLLLRRATNRERILLLAMLSRYHQVKLFSIDKNDILENVIFGGIVDYTKEMPKVFKNSKINLNITLRSIEKGIPLRCLDIMACRGFLMTNYQEDLFTELEDGKDMVVYESIEDALEKADFYLKHDKLREEIANNGYKKMKDCFSYHRQLEKIWSITGLK